MDMIPDTEFSAKANIKVVGVGGGGGNAVQTMIENKVEGVTFICANTDAQALQHSGADIKIQIGEQKTKGLGAGGDPEVGRQSAQESIDKIRDAISGAEMVFVTAGMGGGTGTGAAPVIAQAAKEMGILTVGVVTRPFNVEGSKRIHQAEAGILALREHVDSLIVIPNERLFTLGPKKATLKSMMKLADSVLCNSVSGISDLITHPGMINLDFADVRSAMSGTGGFAMMGIGVASGENRAIEAAKRAINSTLLDDVSITGAKALLINITATEDSLTLEEFGTVNSYITDCARCDNSEQNIIIGTVFDNNMGEDIRISVIATGIEQAPNIESETTSRNTVNTTNTQVQEATAQPANNAPRFGSTTTVRHFAPNPSIDVNDPNQPTFLRNQAKQAQQSAQHTPGKQDTFTFGPDDDLELPSCFRTQAN